MEMYGGCLFIFLRDRAGYGKKLRYDTRKVHRVNLTIISFFAVLICGPIILSKDMIQLFIGLGVIGLAVGNYFLPIKTRQIQIKQVVCVSRRVD